MHACFKILLFRKFCRILMENIQNVPTVVHVIQLALTPVFLLGGVGAILNVLTGRLTRAVDRYRVLTELEVDAAIKVEDSELAALLRRVHLINVAISLCTFCALLVCMSIVTLFLGAEMGLNFTRAISVLFITAIVALTAALLCFLREITLAAAAVHIARYS